MAEALSLVDRIATQSREGEDGCWLWGGWTTKGGYGLLYRPPGSGTRLVHRIAYEALVSELPDGLHIDHRCRTRACWNPAHLEPVTQRVNNERSLDRHRNAVKTACPRGHLYDEANTQSVAGSRKCRACGRENARRYRAQRRAGT